MASVASALSTNAATPALADSPPPPSETARYEGYYKIAIEEYRFSVNLSWERLKFFVTLSLTLAGVVPSLIKLSDADRFPRVGGAVLFLSGCTALFGVLVVWRGHSYYRNARNHMQGIEQRLGLPTENLELKTTGGMKRGHAAVSQRPTASSFLAL